MPPGMVTGAVIWTGEVTEAAAVGAEMQTDPLAVVPLSGGGTGAGPG